MKLFTFSTVQVNNRSGVCWQQHFCLIELQCIRYIVKKKKKSSTELQHKVHLLTEKQNQTSKLSLVWGQQNLSNGYVCTEQPAVYENYGTGRCTFIIQETRSQIELHNLLKFSVPLPNSVCFGEIHTLFLTNLKLFVLPKLSNLFLTTTFILRLGNFSRHLYRRLFCVLILKWL